MYSERLTRSDKKLMSYLKDWELHVEAFSGEFKISNSMRRYVRSISSMVSKAAFEALIIEAKDIQASQKPYVPLHVSMRKFVVEYIVYKAVMNRTSKDSYQRIVKIINSFLLWNSKRSKDFPLMRINVPYNRISSLMTGDPNRERRRMKLVCEPGKLEECLNDNLFLFPEEKLKALKQAIAQAIRPEDIEEKLGLPYKEFESMILVVSKYLFGFKVRYRQFWKFINGIDVNLSPSVGKRRAAGWIRKYAKQQTSYEEKSVGHTRPWSCEPNVITA